MTNKIEEGYLDNDQRWNDTFMSVADELHGLCKSVYDLNKAANTTSRRMHSTPDSVTDAERKVYMSAVYNIKHITRLMQDVMDELERSIPQSVSEGTEVSDKQPKIIEQATIAELSRKTLGSYIRAAGPDREGKLKVSKATADAGHGMREIDPEGAKDMFHRAGGLALKAANRRAGINKAVDKLTKEDTEWPVYARIFEKSKDPHTKGATEPEKIDDNMSPKEKQFAAMHGGLDGNKPEPFVDDAVIDKDKKPGDVVKKAPLNKAPGSQ